MLHGHGNTFSILDPAIQKCPIVVRTGREWRAAEAVQQAEARLRHKAILGAVARGRAGLESLTVTRYDSTSGRETQRLVQEEVRASVEKPAEQWPCGSKVPG